MVDKQLTPDQDKALGRIQLAGVLAVAGIVIAMRVLVLGNGVALWMVLPLGLVAITAVVLAAGLAISRVQQQPYREVMIQSLRAMVDGVRTAPGRLRRRAADMFARARSR